MDSTLGLLWEFNGIIWIKVSQGLAEGPPGNASSYSWDPVCAGGLQGQWH